jgi:hypothetical protein
MGFDNLVCLRTGALAMLKLAPAIVAGSGLSSLLYVRCSCSAVKNSFYRTLSRYGSGLGLGRGQVGNHRPRGHPERREQH